MARVVGIICEYNPFHLGHKYQIDEIKREVPDAKIVAIMSGNATQRASLAIFEKHKRAEAALNLGADLVLELPFPYSSSCAEIFAEGGVSIAEKIGCDYLYFGTEKAKVSDLYDACDALASPEFEVRIRERLQNKRESYITAREKALFDLGFSVKLEANDMLALEYVRAIKKMGAKIEPRAIKRIGNGYNDTSVGEFMSASGIREKYQSDGEFLSVPESTREQYYALASEGKILDFDAFNALLYRYALLCEQSELEGTFDSTPELASLIKNAVVNSKNADEFLQALSSKAFTRARILRVLLYSIFNVKSIERELNYTRLLGANDGGKEILKNAKKSGLCVITKHSDSRTLSEKEKEALSLDYALDMLYLSLQKSPDAPSEAYKKMPILK